MLRWILLPALLAASLLGAAGCEPLPPPREATEAGGPEGEELPVAVRVPIGESPSLGSQDALVTIVEFLDFECPYCQYAHPTIERLIAEYPGDVRWVIKHNPLGFHQRATPASILVIEVREQRGDAAFFEATRMLLGSERLNAAAFQQVMDRFQLDPHRLRRALALGPAHPVIIEDQDQAIDLEVRGTPSFFVNGVPLRGARPYAEFDQVVQGQLAVARGLLQRGVKREHMYAELQRRATPPPALEKVLDPGVTPAMPSLGPPEAEVTIQVFSDFECPFCSSVMPTLDELRSRHPNDIRVVWRHYPLPFHRHAVMAARAAEEARAQGGDPAFWSLARRMLGTRDRPPELLDRATLERYGRELGLEQSRFENALSDDRHHAVIARDIEVAQRVGINATPGFVINGYRLLGAHPTRRFERLVRLALEESGERRANPKRSSGLAY